MASSSTKKITLKTSEGEIFEVDDAFVNESRRIKHLRDTKLTDEPIPLPNISSKILSMVIEYVKKHTEFSVVVDAASGSDEKSLKDWDIEFMKVDMNTLYDLITAAYDLDNESLLDLTWQTMAEQIREMTPDQIIC